MDNNSIENTDLAKQYQDILDRYSKELAASETQPAAGESTLPIETLTVPETPVSPETPVIAEVPVSPEAPPIVEPEPSLQAVDLSEIVTQPDVMLQPETMIPASVTDEILSQPVSSPPPAEVTPSFVPPSPVFESIPPATPPANNIFKYIFILSFLIFLGVFGTIVYTMFFAKVAPVNPGTATPTTVETATPTSTELFCEANDQKVKKGSSFPAADGCNTCTCGEDLTISCTLKACDATPTTTTIIDSGPLKAILATINTQLKTSYKENTLDNGKKWSVDLTKSADKTSVTAIKKAITGKGFVYQASLSGEAGADWKEVYVKTADTCTLEMSQSVLTLSCFN